VPKYYAITLAGETITAFAAASFADAVEIKNGMQIQYNEQNGTDEVFALRKCSASEVKRFGDSAMRFVSIDHMRDLARKK
jgi:hypothetical protein